MAINSTREVDGKIVKRFTPAGTALTAAASLFNGIEFQTAEERYKTELGRLQLYGSWKLNVPDVIAADPEKLKIVMEKVPGVNFKEALYDKQITRMQTLEYLSDCALLLKQIHMYGQHGDPQPANFMVGKDVFALDFEHKTRNTKQEEFAEFYMYALRATRLPKHEVMAAVTQGYGNPPQVLDRPMFDLLLKMDIAERIAHEFGLKL